MYGPVRTVVWEGRSREAPPYPDTHRPILYVENDSAEKSRALVGLLRSRGYRLRLHQPPFYSPTNYAGSRTDLFPGVVSCNLLCIHESRDERPASPR